LRKIGPYAGAFAPALESALEDEDESVRRRVAEALKRIRAAEEARTVAAP
jgi:HEAT repeat protein